jgi:hypothetical protein
MLDGQRDELLRLIAEQVRRAYRRRGMPAPLFRQIDERRALNRVLGWLRWEAATDAEGRNGPADLGAPAAAGWERIALEEEFDVPVECAGREIRLIGRWDRVDRDRGGRIRILDYKTGRGAPGKPGTLEGGLNLQMYLYLLAGAERWRDEGSMTGGVFIHLEPDRPEGPPGAVEWPLAEVRKGQAGLESLVLALLESMEQGVFTRLPHEDRTESRSGLCSWCPTPTICRSWREEESVRHLSDELLIALNRARSIDRVSGGGEE